MRKISEELTRKEMIDPQLEHAGWYLRDHSKVKTEIPVDSYDAELLRGRMGAPQSTRQVDELFESLLASSFFLLLSRVHVCPSTMLGKVTLGDSDASHWANFPRPVRTSL